MIVKRMKIESELEIEVWDDGNGWRYAVKHGRTIAEGECYGSEGEAIVKAAADATEYLANNHFTLVEED